MSYFAGDEPECRRLEQAAREILDYGLGQGQSLVEPESQAWREEIVSDVRLRIGENANAGEGTFLEKLQAQLDGAPREAYLLVAELRALQVLPLGNLTAATKLNHVQSV